MTLFFSQAFESKIFVSCLVAWIASQIIKGILLSISRRKLALSYFIAGEGGMPSSHTTLVSSLFLAVYSQEGFSTSFMIALSFGLVVIRDAVGLRQQTSSHARILNQIAAQVNDSHDLTNNLSESVGHTALEVLAGFIVAFAAVQVVFNFL